MDKKRGQIGGSKRTKCPKILLSRIVVVLIRLLRCPDFVNLGFFKTNIFSLRTESKGIVFFPRKSWVIQWIKTQNCVFFPAKRKKKHAIFSNFFLIFLCFFLLLSKFICYSFNRSDICVFFMSPEKKHSIFINSIDFVPNCVNSELLQVE